MSLRGIISLVSTFLVVIVLTIGVFVFVERVPEGKVAVVYTPSGGATEVLKPGWHVVGLFEKTTQYPTRIQIIKDNVSVTTTDGKKVTMPVRYEMKVDASKVLGIYKELGSQNIESIQEGYLYQKLFKASREIVSQYSVLDIYGTKTSEASAKVTELMAEEAGKLGFLISDVTLGTPELDEETQKAIDERVKASQENELKKTQLENDRIEAERQKVQAQGKAEAEVEAARGTAEANNIINKSLTPELIEMKEAEARIKHGWVEVLTGEAIVDVK